MILTIGDRVKRERDRLGMAQHDLSMATGFTVTYISQVESGHIKSPGVVKLAKIAKALGVTPNDLLGIKAAKPKAAI